MICTNSTDITVTKMITKNIRAEFNKFWASNNRNPKPPFADCISENITPVNAVAAASFNPLNIDGSELGIII